MGEIEILARGVIVSRGKILLCHSKGAENTFLPGGHIEHGESARKALAREIREELGKRAGVGVFLGAIEHSFLQKGKRIHEMNLIFAASINGLSAARDPAARESHVEFFWCLLTSAALVPTRLEPAPLRRLLPRWCGVKGRARWVSTLE